MLKYARSLSCLAVLGLFVSLSAARAEAPKKLVPGDADLVAHVNVSSLLKSGLFKKYLAEDVKKALAGGNPATALLDQIGFDPLKDISDVTFCLKMAGGISIPDFVVIAQGTFDVSKIAGLIEEHADQAGDRLKISKKGSLTVYELQTDQVPLYACFLDGKTLVAASTESMLESCIDQSTGKKTAKFGKDMSGLMSKLDTKASAYGAFVLPAEVKDLLAGVDQVADLADKLQGLTISVKVADDVAADLVFHTTDDDAAQQLSIMVEQGKQMLGILALQNEDLGPLVTDIVDGINVSTKGTTVVMSCKLSASMVEKIIKTVREMQGA